MSTSDFDKKRELPLPNYTGTVLSGLPVYEIDIDAVHKTKTSTTAARPCRWVQEDEDSDTFSTSCNRMFTVLDVDDPEDLGFHFCCYCGRPLVTEAWSDPDAEPAAEATA